MAVENWNTNEALNGTIEGENIAEGSMPGDLNDVLRKITAEIKVFFNKTYRKNETIIATPTGAADPFTVHVENDIWIEFTP